MDKMREANSISQKPRILVLGDIAMDWIVQASSLEMPVAKLSVECSEVITERLGGGGLVFGVAAQEAGFATTLVAAIGRDASGAAGRQYLADSGVTAILTEVNDASTGKSLIIRDEIRDVKAMVSTGARMFGCRAPQLMAG